MPPMTAPRTTDARPTGSTPAPDFGEKDDPIRPPADGRPVASRPPRCRAPRPVPELARGVAARASPGDAARGPDLSRLARLVAGRGRILRLDGTAVQHQPGWGPRLPASSPARGPS